MKKVVVRAFGARLRGGSEAEQLATSVFLQQNRLWNKLVEIEKENRLAYRSALVQSDEELSLLTERLAAEDATIEAIVLARNAARAKARSKKNADDAISHAQALKSATARRKEIYTLMKACRERAKAAAKPLIEAAELERRQQVKEAASLFPMWWCHSETVLKKYDLARGKAMRTGAELRFHRFDGNGSMGARFSSEGGMIDRIRAGKTDILQFREPTPDELGRMSALKADGGRRVIVRVRAGNKADDGTIPFLEFLVTMHAERDLPEDMPLKTVTLRRDMFAGRPDWKIVLTFSAEVESLPEVELPAGAVGVDFGWRLVNDEGVRALRVATISDGSNCVQHVLLGDDWLQRMERSDRLRSTLQEITNKFAAASLPLLDEENLKKLSDDEWFKVLAGKARRAKNAYPGLWMDICRAHESAGQPLGAEIAEMMNAWNREANHIMTQAVHSKRKALDHRKHLYRNVAARLVRDFGHIAVEDADFSKMALLETSDGTENELTLTSRRNRTWASPSELRLAIAQAAKREQRELVDVPAARTTSDCSACGHAHAGAMTDLVFVCQGCSKVWDQDENAANNIRNFSLKTRNSSLESSSS
ncbi:MULTISPECIES: zinc ribbon domain-containing protein [Polaromonas]|uniref:Zinc ribbon domain-containing protein n=1 Tax=Polaromonas aquatica TaxID=332657 RepID=A0ABW1TZ53_9BURK